MTRGPAWVLLLIVALGASGMLGQILLWRELVVGYGGNEMSTGIILANWLMAEAAGAFVFARRPIRRLRPLPLFGLLTGLYGAAVVAAITAARTAKTLTGHALGEPVGLGYTALSSLLISAPVAFLHGALFPTAGHLYRRERPGSDDAAVGTLYLWETAGTLLGAILATWYFAAGGHSYRLAALLLLLNGVVLGAATALHDEARRHGLGWCVAWMGIALGLPMLAGADRLQARTLARQWRPFPVLASQTSPYGNLAVLDSGGQFIFVVDGQPVHLLPEPDHVAVETVALLPLLAHPAPRRALVIGGGVGGLLHHILQHPAIEQVDYVELDPILLDLFRRFSTPLSAAELGDPRVRLHPCDGRRFLQDAPTYDLIWIGIPGPSTLQANRYFTAEFFRLARRHLSPEGLLVLNVRGEIARLTEELRLLHGCLLETLKQAFAQTRVLPGEGRYLYLASPQLPLSALSAEMVARRWRERGGPEDGRLPWHLENRLHPGWTAWFEERRSRVPTAVNRDLRPVAVHYALKHHQAVHAPRLSAALRFAGRHAPLAVVMALSAAGFAAWATGRLRSAWLTRRALPVTVMTTGFAAMLLDLLVILAFQSVFGYVYGWIGLLMASFMAGASAGALAGRRWSRAARRRGSPLLIADAGLLLFCAGFPGLLSGLVRLAVIHEPLAMTLFLATGFVAGGLTGLLFPLAAAWKLGQGETADYTAGVLQASDLIGGWVAGLVGAAVLLPRGGATGTCGTIVGLKAASLMLIVLGICALRGYHQDP